MLSSGFCNDSVDGVICHVTQTQGQVTSVVNTFIITLTYIKYISQQMTGKESPFEISTTFQMF